MREIWKEVGRGQSVGGGEGVAVCVCIVKKKRKRVNEYRGGEIRSLLTRGMSDLTCVYTFALLDPLSTSLSLSLSWNINRTHILTQEKQQKHYICV